MRLLEEISISGPGSSQQGYFFMTPELSLRLDLVREYIQNTEAPVLVTGETGAGKSAFLDQVVRRSDGCWRLVRMPAVASFTPIDVVRFLSAELRLPMSDSNDTLVGELTRFFNKIAMRRRITVIIVDDAHELSDASLLRLVTLGEELDCTNYRLLMTGLPALRPRLTSLLAASRPRTRPHIVTIPSLNEHEIASYIDMKLYHAGVDSRRPLRRTVIDDIAHSSQGHPGRIDAITDALLSGTGKEPDGRWVTGRIRQLARHLSGLGAPR